MSDGDNKKTYAQRRKDERKEELRLLLRGQEYLRQLHKWFDEDLTPDQLAVAKFKADIAHRLLAKCLPDMKAIEVNAEIQHSYAARVPETIENPEQWQQKHSPSLTVQ